ncbi:hypothetical protein THRCLA_02454 [Thraustotheca clavata]|uniref:M96 mating-specific protein family n=1 Tax=Thraustotheca clavata TaxID=74557 RepID=A0A1W0A5U9_9STRA|nr:hypothetical protein THRCLA_02454 [Thraustotheca clavata]
MQAIFDDFATIPADECALLSTDALMMEDLEILFPSNPSQSPEASDHATSSEANSDQEIIVEKPKKINVSRKRQREELEYLRAKVVELEVHLQKLQEVQEITPPKPVTEESPWKTVALQMKSEKEAAIAEREHLKLNLQTQIEFGKSLEALIKKRPKLTVLPKLENDQWKMYRLVENPALRREAVQNITSQVYDGLSGAMIESGLLDREDDFALYAPSLSKYFDDQLITTAALCQTIPFEYTLVARMTWLLLTAGCSLERSSFHRLETFDEDTIYIANEGRWEFLLNQTRLLMRRFIESNRIIFVMRTILEDELTPHSPEALVTNKCAWFMLEPTSEGHTRIKFYQKSTLPMVQSEALLKHPKFSDVNSPYYRIGNITDAALLNPLTATVPLEENYVDVDAMIMEDFGAMYLPIVNSNLKVSTPLTDSATASSGSDMESPVKQTTERPKKINESRKRQREELEYLRVKVDELRKHLTVLKQIKEIETENETPWQKLAHQMRIDKQNALLENEKLKSELQEQIEFGKTLQSILKKRPRLTTLPTLDNEQWRLYRLVKEPVVRANAVDEILKQQYLALPGAMVESNLVDMTDDYLCCTPKLARNHEDQIISETVWCCNISYEFGFVTRCLWSLMADPSRYHHPSFALLEVFDDNTRYMSTIGRVSPSLTSNCRFVIRRVTEENREVILMRSILEDELMPHDKTVLINNKTAWFTVEPTATGSRMKFFQKSTLPMLQSQLFLQNPKFKLPNSPYYRVGSVTDAIMTSMREFVTDFKAALILVLQMHLTNYNATGTINESEIQALVAEAHPGCA